MNSRHTLASLLLALAAGAAAAQAPAAETTPPAAGALPMVAAEVRRVDLASARITLKHRAIPNLDMPPMSMVFQLQTPALAAGLKPGDTVRFSAVQVQGAYTVVDLQREQSLK
jgi:Cu(I)/Ag(I) efflux system protein CusF